MCQIICRLLFSRNIALFGMTFRVDIYNVLSSIKSWKLNGDSASFLQKLFPFRFLEKYLNKKNF